MEHMEEKSGSIWSNLVGIAWDRLGSMRDIRIQGPGASWAIPVAAFCTGSVPVLSVFWSLFNNFFLTTD